MRNFLYITGQYISILTANRKNLALALAGITLSLLLAAAGEEAGYVVTERQSEELASFPADSCIVAGSRAFSIGAAVSSDAGAKIGYTYCRYGSAPVRMRNSGRTRTLYCNLFPAGIVSEGAEPVLAGESGQACERLRLLHGSYFTPGQVSGKEPVCILEKSTAEILFGSEDPVGEVLHFMAGGRSCTLTVTGVICDLASSAEKNAELNAGLVRERFIPGGDISTDRYLLTPLDWFDAVFGESGREIKTVCTFSAGPEGREAFFRELRHIFGDRNGCSVFTYKDLCLNAEENVERVRSLLVLFRMLLSVLSGLMMMNTMEFYIRGRAREIGIRRALGAEKKHICREFLIQGSLLTLISAGISAGILSAAVLYIRSLGFLFPAAASVPRIHPATIAAMTAEALCGGCLFSLLPAMRAADASPARAMGRRT